MAIGEPKPEIKESTEKYIEFGDLSLSKEGYIRWLNNATSKLREEYLNILANSANSGKTIAELGDEIIKRVTIDKKNLEMSDADIKNEAVRSAKKTMLVVVDSIRHLEPKQKEKVISIAPQERLGAYAEIKKSSLEEISTQAKDIMKLATRYEEQYLPVIIDLWEKYDAIPMHDESGLKNKYYNEFVKVKKEYISYIQNDLENISLKEISGDEYADVREARAYLEDVKVKMAAYGIDSAFEIEDEETYPEIEPVIEEEITELSEDDIIRQEAA